jgi:hypothetical protein
MLRLASALAGSQVTDHKGASGIQCRVPQLGAGQVLHGLQQPQRGNRGLHEGGPDSGDGSLPWHAAAGCVVLRPAHMQAMPVHGQAQSTDTVWPGWDGVPWLSQLGRQVVDTRHKEFGQCGQEEEGGREMMAVAVETTRGPLWQWQRRAAQQCLGQRNGQSWEETRRSQ